MTKNFQNFLNEIYVGKDFGDFDILGASKDVTSLVTKINNKYKIDIDESKFDFKGLQENQINIRKALIAKATEYFGVHGTENKITNSKFNDFLREYTESQYSEYSYTFINAIINKLKEDNPNYQKDIESAYKKGSIKSIHKGKPIGEFLTGDVYFYTSTESKRYGIFLYRVNDTEFAGIEANVKIPNETGFGVFAYKRNSNSGVATASRTLKKLSISSMACKDKNKSEVPKEYEANATEVLANLEIFLETIGNPECEIISGYRTKQHNDNVGGADESQHLFARAVDFKVEGMKPSEVYKKMDELMKSGKIKNGGLGCYDTFVHYDCRDDVGIRWSKKSKNEKDLA